MNPKKKGTPPRCKVCKELIPITEGEDNYKWLERKVCRPKTDTKPVKCITVYRSQASKQKKGTTYNTVKDSTKKKVPEKRHPYIPVPVPSAQDLRTKELAINNTAILLPECVRKMNPVTVQEGITARYIPCSQIPRYTPPGERKHDVLPHYYG